MAVTISGTTGLTANGSVFTDASGNVGIGTSSPTSNLNVYNSTSAIISVDGDSTTIFRATRYSTDSSNSTLQLRKARGTLASPTAVANGDVVGSMPIQAYGGTNFRSIASIAGVVDTYTSDTNISGFLTFSTNVGSTGVTERMRIDSSGNVLVTNVAGLGYGTGAGGTVTQATSKSTAVTLNKPTGQITMNAAALAAGAAVSFQLTNSICTTTDTMVVANITNSSYRVEVLRMGAGFGIIQVTNITGGSLSEAIVINFTVIKGATS